MAKTKTTTPGPKAKNDCICFSEFVRYHEEIVDNATGATETTDIPVYGPCGETTHREFAPGHDAKLKGVLIRCYVANHPYIVEAGGTLTHYDPYDVAKRRGWAHFLDAAKARADEKLAKGLKSAAKSETKAKSKSKSKSKNKTEAKPGVPTKVKIGRWEYPLVRILDQGYNDARVEYLDRKGNVQTKTVKLAAVYGKAS